MARRKGVTDKHQCINCPNFRIVYEPLGNRCNAWDCGMAECRKHGKTIDFISRAELARLRCVEGGEEHD